MNDLSMHILDIAQNSFNAGASLLKLIVEENINDNYLKISFIDNGCGIDSEKLKTIESPFTTSRKTRKVGLGIPFLKQACLQTGGRFEIQSQVGIGTTLIAQFVYDSIDRAPLGDLVDTIYLLFINEENVDVDYKHIYNNNAFEIKTSELKNILQGVSFKEYDIMVWIKGYIEENLKEIKK